MATLCGWNRNCFQVDNTLVVTRIVICCRCHSEGNHAHTSRIRIALHPCLIVKLLNNTRFHNVRTEANTQSKKPQAAKCIAAFESRRRGEQIDVRDMKRKVCSACPQAYTIKRFRTLLPVFQNSLPGDLVTAVAHLTTSHQMYVAEPALEYLSVLSKYGAFKNCLSDAWARHTPRRRSHGLLFNDGQHLL